MPAVLSLLPLFSDSESFWTVVPSFGLDSVHGSVRITTLFGLSMALCPRFWPYYHSFRTHNRSVPAILSAITPLFGLSTALRPRFWPYYHSFRTQNGSVPVVLSLLPLFSDSAWLCARSSVPITTLFGLCAVLCPWFWPYYHSFRTQHGSVPAVLALLPSIRTQHGSVPAVLSVLPLFSDSQSLCARGSGPITLYSDPVSLCARTSVPATTYSNSARLCIRSSVRTRALFGFSGALFAQTLSKPNKSIKQTFV